MKKRRRNPLLLTVHNPSAVRWRGVRREDGSPVRIVETGERWIVQQQHGRKWVPVADAGNSIDAFRVMRVELGTVDEQKGKHLVHVIRRRGGPREKRDREHGAWQAQEGRRAASRVHRELRRENPTGDALAAFRTFHEVDPKEIVERSIPAVRGDLVALGDLVAICYRPTRGWRRGPAFEHRFGRGAILAATADGKALVLIPGPKPFRVDWRRGIVD